MTTHIPPRTDVQARGDLAEMLLPLAVSLARIVHGDGGPEDVQEELAVLDEQQKDALIVVLAGLVDTDQPVCAALGWLGFDEDGRQIEPPWDDWTRLRDLADTGDTGDAGADLVDEVAVEAYIAGRRVHVTDRERLEAIVRAVTRHGLSMRTIDTLHGLPHPATFNFMQQERKKARDRGLPFPELPSAVRRFTDVEVVDIRERADKGATYIDLALAYATTRESIQRIVEGATYRHVGGPIRDRRRRGAAGQEAVAERTAA